MNILIRNILFRQNIIKKKHHTTQMIIFAKINGCTRQNTRTCLPCTHRYLCKTDQTADGEKENRFHHEPHFGDNQ